MLCQFVILSQSRNGKVIKCTMCESKIALMYNNINQSFSIESFYELKRIIESEDVLSFFFKYPNEEKLHLRTKFQDLFFSFSQDELKELRKLFCEADFKLSLYENLNKNLN